MSYILRELLPRASGVGVPSPTTSGCPRFAKGGVGWKEGPVRGHLGCVAGGAGVTTRDPPHEMFRPSHLSSTKYFRCL